MKKQIEIFTLDEHEWAKKMQSIILCSPTVTAMQCKVDGKFYNTCSPRRGAVAQGELPDQVYDICSSPDKIAQLDDAFMNIVREKISNMMVVYDALLEKMYQDKTLTIEQCDELKFKDMSELLDCIKTRHEEHIRIMNNPKLLAKSVEEMMSKTEKVEAPNDKFNNNLLHT